MGSLDNAGKSQNSLKARQFHFALEFVKLTIHCLGLSGFTHCRLNFSHHQPRSHETKDGIDPPSLACVERQDTVRPRVVRHGRVHHSSVCLVDQGIVSEERFSKSAKAHCRETMGL